MEEKENFFPEEVKLEKKLSLSLKRKRYQSVSESKVAEMSVPQVPRNTDASTRWSIKNLTEWIFDYNERN